MQECQRVEGGAEGQVRAGDIRRRPRGRCHCCQRRSRRSICVTPLAGVSEFAETPELIGEKHLKALLDHALAVVPSDQVESTPFFLLATAGMRLLSKPKQKALLKEICTYTRKHTKFHLPIFPLIHIHHHHHQHSDHRLFSLSSSSSSNQSLASNAGSSTTKRTRED